MGVDSVPGVFSLSFSLSGALFSGLVRQTNVRGVPGTCVCGDGGGLLVEGAPGDLSCGKLVSLACSSDTVSVSFSWVDAFVAILGSALDGMSGSGS